MTTKQKLIAAVRAAWNEACAAHGIDGPTADFVVFPDNDPGEAKYNAAMQQYMIYCRSINVGN